MIVEIDGQQYDVPDNATPAHIQRSLGLKAPEKNVAPESKGLSGVATDAFSGLMRGALSVPNALYHLPGEAVGAVKQLADTDPTRRFQNIVGGLGELGHSVLSAPGNIRDYLVRKELASKESPSFRLPESVLPKEYDYAAALGRQGEKPGDTLISSLPSLAAGAPLEAKLLSALRELPLTKKMAARPYREARALKEERGIERVDVPKELLTEAADYFNPKKKAHRDLLKKAKMGDYDALHTLQSDLGAQSRQLLKFLSPGSDKIRGLEANDLRHRILSSMKEDLEKQGHHDIAALRQKGANKYRQHFDYVRPTGKLAAGYAATHIPGYSLADKLHSLFSK